MIVEIPNELHRPKRKVDVGFEISISKIDDEVLDNKDFDEWLCYKASELGHGNHSEYFLGDTPDEDYLVEFSVVLTTLSFSDWINTPNKEK